MGGPGACRAPVNSRVWLQVAAEGPVVAAPAVEIGVEQKIKDHTQVEFMEEIFSTEDLFKQVAPPELFPPHVTPCHHPNGDSASMEGPHTV